MKPAISTFIALGTTFCLIGTKTRNVLKVLGNSASLSLLLGWIAMDYVGHR